MLLTASETAHALPDVRAPHGSPRPRRVPLALAATRSLEVQGGVESDDDEQTKQEKKAKAAFGGQGVGSAEQAGRGARHAWPDALALTASSAHAAGR